MKKLQAKKREGRDVSDVNGKGRTAGQPGKTGER